VVALVAILTAPAIYADGLPSPFEAPSVRISPPIGIAAQEEPSFFELHSTWLQVRIGPPGG
jgi:hypothetical protein